MVFGAGSSAGGFAGAGAASPVAGMAGAMALVVRAGSAASTVVANVVSVHTTAPREAAKRIIFIKTSPFWFRILDGDFLILFNVELARLAFRSAAQTHNVSNRRMTTPPCVLAIARRYRRLFLRTQARLRRSGGRLVRGR